jgi:TolA-binding protein
MILLGVKFNINIRLLFYILRYYSVFIFNCTVFSLCSVQVYSQVNVEKELKRLNAKIDRANVRLDSLETKNRETIPELKMIIQNNTQSQTHLDSLNENIMILLKKLDDKISILENKTTYFENKLLTLTNSYREMTNLKNNSKVRDVVEKLTPELYIDKYNESLRHVQNGDFDFAVVGLTMLIRDDPHNRLADNSQYWLGECYYSKMKYTRAISEFKNVFNFPGTDKDDDAQLKIGMSYLAMSNIADAKIQFQKLLDVYPDSEYAISARDHLEQISLE